MDMIEAGWYQDPNTPGMQRYYDGSAWTEHTAPVRYEPADSESQPQPESGAVPPVGSPSGDPPASSSRLGELGGLAFIGAFVGLMFGGLLFNAIGAISPVTTERGTVERLEISYNSGSQSNQSSYELHGTTASGIAWKITDEAAYRAVESQGYPQAVIVGIGDWTGTAEQVIGQGWAVDHQSTGARIGWGIAFGLLTVGGLFAALLIGRTKKFGLAGGGLFALSYFVVGGWLGYLMFRWIQSG